VEIVVAYFEVLCQNMAGGTDDIRERPLSGYINPLNAELNPICHMLALLGAHHILHVSRVRVNESPTWCKLCSL